MSEVRADYPPHNILPVLAGGACGERDQGDGQGRAQLPQGTELPLKHSSLVQYKCTLSTIFNGNLVQRNFVGEIVRKKIISPFAVQ